MPLFLWTTNGNCINSVYAITYYKYGNENYLNVLVFKGPNLPVSACRIAHTNHGWDEKWNDSNSKTDYSNSNDIINNHQYMDN